MAVVFVFCSHGVGVLSLYIIAPPPPYQVAYGNNATNNEKEKMAAACGGAPHIPVKSSIGRVQANVTESKPRKSVMMSDSSRQSYFTGTT